MIIIKVGSFSGEGITFTFERKDILDEEGKLINICIISTMPVAENPLIFSRYGGLGTAPLTGKKYADSNYEIDMEFDLINVEDVQFGIYYDNKGEIKDYYFIDGILYLDNARGFLTASIDSNYKTITLGEDVYTLVEE